MESYLLPGSDPEIAQLPFQLVEELLDGIQPRGVLGVEQQGRIHHSGRIVDSLRFVDHSVVHQYDYVLIAY